MLSSNSIAFVLAGLSATGGFIVSLLGGDWSWFARSGSVIVIIGIVLTSTQVLENARRLRIRRAHWDNQGSNMGARESGNLNPSMHDWAGDMRALSRARHSEEDTWEYERSGVYMLIAGTLLWGFGDLLGWFFA